MGQGAPGAGRDLLQNQIAVVAVLLEIHARDNIDDGLPVGRDLWVGNRNGLGEISEFDTTSLGSCSLRTENAKSRQDERSKLSPGKRGRSILQLGILVVISIPLACGHSFFLLQMHRMFEQARSSSKNAVNERTLLARRALSHVVAGGN